MRQGQRQAKPRPGQAKARPSQGQGLGEDEISRDHAPARPTQSHHHLNHHLAQSPCSRGRRREAGCEEQQTSARCAWLVVLSLEHTHFRFFFVLASPPLGRLDEPKRPSAASPPSSPPPPWRCWSSAAREAASGPVRSSTAEGGGAGRSAPGSFLIIPPIRRARIWRWEIGGRGVGGGG